MRLSQAAIDVKWSLFHSSSFPMKNKREAHGHHTTASEQHTRMLTHYRKQCVVVRTFPNHAIFGSTWINPAYHGAKNSTSRVSCSATRRSKSASPSSSASPLPSTTSSRAVCRTPRQRTATYETRMLTIKTVDSFQLGKLSGAPRYWTERRPLIGWEPRDRADRVWEEKHPASFKRSVKAQGCVQNPMAVYYILHCTNALCTTHYITRNIMQCSKHICHTYCSIYVTDCRWYLLVESVTSEAYCNNYWTPDYEQDKRSSS